MKRCPQCKKILFRKKNGTLFCPNECEKHEGRAAFNTYVERDLERRGPRDTFDPWSYVR